MRPGTGLQLGVRVGEAGTLSLGARSGEERGLVVWRWSSGYGSLTSFYTSSNFEFTNFGNHVEKLL